jgi:ubiquinone/menaquinone biosynthesis C-methylase UbiE
LESKHREKRRVAEYFDEQSPLYFDANYRKVDERYPILYLRQKYILEMLGDCGRGRALDVGCGSGAMVFELCRRGFEAVGADLSLSMVSNVRGLFAAFGVPKPFLTVADLEHLPFADCCFDLIVCAGVIEYLERDEKALEEIARVLKPGGVAFVTVTNGLAPFWVLETAGRLLGVWSMVVSLVKGGAAFPRARVHVPRVLVRLASKSGLVAVNRAYFHFLSLPFPLGMIFPTLSRKASLKMENLSRSWLGFLGRGCILRMVKKHIV